MANNCSQTENDREVDIGVVFFVDGDTDAGTVEVHEEDFGDFVVGCPLVDDVGECVVHG